MNPYDTATITNIKRGKGTRRHVIYAELRAANGDLLMAATLDHIKDTLHERMTKTEA